MDSKSIARKGVGVRVPALAPTATRAADELAGALLPGILAELGRMSSRFRELATELLHEPTGPPSTVLDPDALEELERGIEREVGLGWTLGVLACAADADLLLDRREVRGIQLVCERVEVALIDRPLSPSADHLPGVAPEVGAGWEVPFAVAYLLFAVGASRPRGRPLRWTGAPGPRDSLGITLARRPGDEAAWERVARLLARVTGVEPVDTGERIGLSLPRAWTTR